MMSEYDRTKYKKVPDLSATELGFLKKKWRHYFERMDVNGNGVLTREDYQKIAERMIKYNNLDEAGKARVTKNYMGVYDVYHNGKEKTSYEEFETIMLDLRRNDEVFHQHMTVSLPKFVPIWFDAIDTDGDGFISVEEYKVFLKCYGYPEKDAMEAFKAIDINKDGVICKAEFFEACREFCDGVDPNAPGNNFFGPVGLGI